MKTRLLALHLNPMDSYLFHNKFSFNVSFVITVGAQGPCTIVHTSAYCIYCMRTALPIYMRGIGINASIPATTDLSFTGTGFEPPTVPPQLSGTREYR